MLDDHGYGLSRRRVTVSTSGVVPMIDRLREDCPVALAVSLHAPTDPLRDQLVPLNKKYPIEELLAACNRYLDKAPRDFITFEYCMLQEVNDSPEQARELVTAFVRSGELRPVTRLRTRRKRWSLHSGDGDELAELVDDRVSVLQRNRIVFRRISQ